MLGYDCSDGSREVIAIAFPRKVDSNGGWAWDEVEVRPSAIDGYGLMPKQSESLDWMNLRYPVYLPLLGRETELNSRAEADIFGCVLQGASAHSTAAAISREAHAPY